MPTYSAFDGQVVFEVGKYTLLGLVINDSLRALMPDVKKGSTTDALVDNLVTFLARTRGLTFNFPAEDVHPGALAIRDFWTFTLAHPGNHQAIWLAFLTTLGSDENNAWMDAVREAQRDELHAPEDAQPDADDKAVDADPLD